jgi:hypothetical protein
MRFFLPRPPVPRGRGQGEAIFHLVDVVTTSKRNAHTDRIPALSKPLLMPGWRQVVPCPTPL